MSEDFEDLYNIYNEDGKEYAYTDEDLYGDSFSDVQVDYSTDDISIENSKTTHEEHSNTEKPTQVQTTSTQENQPRKPQRFNNNTTSNNKKTTGYSTGVYQNYLSNFQRNLQQQMAMNSYYMQQQMLQTQYFQTMPQPFQSKPRFEKRPTTKREIESTEAQTNEEGKMFIGGLNWETTDESLRQYFSQFGEVISCSILRDPNTQLSRGFGFLTMDKSSSVDKIVNQETHVVDGKKIDPKRAITKDEQDKSEKIFVGGISPEVNEEEFRQYFTQFGTVIDATLMMERDTGKPRGFGFITFESNEGIDKIFSNSNLSIKGKTIEVKKAMRKGKSNQQNKQINNHSNKIISNSTFIPFIPNNNQFIGTSYNLYQQQQMTMLNSTYQSNRTYQRNQDKKNNYYRSNENNGKRIQSKNTQHYRPY